MDKKAVGEISIPKAFNKKWWDSNRSTKIKGTGTGALLEAWKKTYSPTPNKFSTVQVAATRKAGEALVKSLKEAQKLCGTTQPDDLAGIKKMLGMLDIYESLLERREKELKSLSDALERSIATYNKAKPALLEVGKALTEVDKRIERVRIRLEKPLQETEKKQLLETMAVIRKDLDELLKDAGQATGRANDFDTSLKSVFEAGRKDPGMRPAFTRYDAMKAGFFEVGDRLHDEMLSRSLDVQEMMRDLSSTETADSTIKLLTEQSRIVQSLAFNEYAYVVDLAKEWLPKLILARKKPETIKDSVRELMVVEESLVNSTRMGKVIEGQLARVTKLSSKAASRFPDHPGVRKALETVEANVKQRQEQRAQMLKVHPPFYTQVREVLAASL